MKNIFFLNDSKDIWLFPGMINSKSKIFWRKTEKNSSFHYALNSERSASKQYGHYIRSIGCKIQEFTEINDDFLNQVLECDYFFTKECLPFDTFDGINDRIREKVISIGWVGESCVTYPDNKYRVENRYKYKFVDEQLIHVYRNMNLENVIPDHPKYSLLNAFNTRESMIGFLQNSLKADTIPVSEDCANERLKSGHVPAKPITILNKLDKNHKYATLFWNMCHCDAEHPANLGKEQTWHRNDCSLMDQDIMSHFVNILNFMKNNSYKIIFKLKPKQYYDSMYDYLKIIQSMFPDFICCSEDLPYHNPLLLLSISEFSFGFNTSAALESEVIGKPFVHFWRREPHDDNYPVDEQSVDVLNKNLHKWATKNGQNFGYRLAQSENTFNIKLGQQFDETSKLLNEFLEKTRYYNHDYKKQFKLHPIIKEALGGDGL